MDYSCFQPPFNPFTVIIVTLNLSLVSSALPFTLDLQTRGISCSSKSEHRGVVSTSCHFKNVRAAHARSAYEYVCEL